MEDRASDQDAYTGSKASKFRYKSKSTSGSHLKRPHSEDEKDSKDSKDAKKHHSHKRHRSNKDHKWRSHSSSKRRHRHPSSGKTVHEPTFTRNGGYDDPDHRHRESLYDGLDEDLASPPQSADLDTDQAFRESLFDALADDEGAAYWEGVYGQPLHVYPNTKAGPEGQLERMSNEEYAEYVRQKMWEKSHQHILEEREARETARKRGKDRRRELEAEATQQEEETEKIRRRMQESLRQVEERKKVKEAEAAWTLYLKKWEELRELRDFAREAKSARELIPWPVVSGKRRHVSKADIEYFFENSSAWEEDAAALLKLERVRWHPDKMQQRFGQHLDVETTQSVTAVFQVIDKLWNERRR